MVGWDPSQKIKGWRNLFSETEREPIGLKNLAELDETASDRLVCNWAAQYGLLGFWPSCNPVTPNGYFIPTFVYGKLLHCYEPVDCIRSAAKRANNVIQLWLALEKSFRGSGVHGLRSVLNLDKTDSSWVGSDPIHCRVSVNGECRSRQPVPETPREWRYLANVLLAEYVQEHIANNIRVSLRVRAQKKGEDDKEIKPSPCWNLMPLWEIETALAAYYVELLMVIRRFRACKTCGRDISHQRVQSTYCRDRSTCRSKDWHRQQSDKRKATNKSIR